MTPRAALCENFLYVFKAARTRAARADDSGARPPLPLALPLRDGLGSPVVWRGHAE
jgi:hypothetical protein